MFCKYTNSLDEKRTVFGKVGPFLADRYGPGGPLLATKISPAGPLLGRTTFAMTVHRRPVEIDFNGYVRVGFRQPIRFYPCSTTPSHAPFSGSEAVLKNKYIGMYDRETQVFCLVSVRIDVQNNCAGRILSC